MPAVIRKTSETFVEVKRGALRAVRWQVDFGVWQPPTDVYETEEAYVVQMEIAGMRGENFELSLLDDVLYISGIRRDAPIRRAVHRMEIRSGEFASAVRLFEAVNLERAVVEYQDGFLTVTLPKEPT
ncbi:MAG: Hsp20/alpha crystallin family protein [Anaerolineales bacterium]|nr:Hsp20/alpha crystallin family protein [Anaerolineales bacterium]